MPLNAKNLTYDPKEPKFLRELREQQQSTDLSRHKTPLARPRKQKAEIEEDEPTYVLEEGNGSVSKAEYELFLEGPKEADIGEEKRAGITSTSEWGGDTGIAAVSIEGLSQKNEESSQQKTSVGPSKKRKVVKIIADEERNDTKLPILDTLKKAKKRKIKLSFDADASGS